MDIHAHERALSNFVSAPLPKFLAALYVVSALPPSLKSVCCMSIVSCKSMEMQSGNRLLRELTSHATAY